MCVAVMTAGVQSQRHTTVPYTCLACNTQDTWPGHFRPQHLSHAMFCVQCDICGELFTTLPGSSEHFRAHVVEPRVQPLMGLRLHPATTYVTRALGPIATAAVLPRSSAAPLPPITLLYMTASHLTWTARQLAATGANAGSRRNAMSADADASFRRYVSICFPEGLLNAKSMSPAEIAAAMLPHYDVWLRHARSAIGYPFISQ